MKRREFFKKAGIGIASLVAAPLISIRVFSQENSNGISGVTQPPFTFPFTFESNSECYRPCGRGVYDKLTDRTYLVYLNQGFRPWIVAYDHSNRKWSDPVRISRETRKDDQPDHFYPSMWMDKEGHIHVVHGSHGDSYKYSVSRKPHDISSWEERPPIGPPQGYPQPIVSSDGEVYLFSTLYSSPRRLIYRKSEDGGDTFDSPEDIIEGCTSSGLYGIYVGSIKHQPASDTEGEKFHIPWVAGGKIRGEQDSVFYCCLNIDNGHIYNAQGEDLGERVTYPDGWEACLVARPRHNAKNVGVIPNTGITKEGKPFVVWRELEKDDQGQNSMFHFYFSIYEPEKRDWVTRHIHKEGIPKPGALGRCEDVDVAEDGRITYYCPTGKAMKMLTSEDNGKNWKQEIIFSSPVAELERLYFAALIDSAHMGSEASRHPEFRVTFKQHYNPALHKRVAQFAWGGNGMLNMIRDPALLR